MCFPVKPAPGARSCSSEHPVSQQDFLCRLCSKSAKQDLNVHEKGGYLELQKLSGFGKFVSILLLGLALPAVTNISSCVSQELAKICQWKCNGSSKICYSQSEWLHQQGWTSSASPQSCIPGMSLLCDHAHYTDKRYTENTALLTAFANTLRNAKGFFFFISNGSWSQCVLKHTLYLNRMKIMADRAIPRQHK